MVNLDTDRGSTAGAEERAKVNSFSDDKNKRDCSGIDRLLEVERLW